MNDTTSIDTETPQRNSEAGRLSGAAPCSAFLPTLQDMLAMGVPETTAVRWNDAVWLLKSKAEHMAEVIEKKMGDKPVASEAAENFREAMRRMRPNH